jgi:ATP-dependent Clp protease ATP-binding subunit ClpA
MNGTVRTSHLVATMVSDAENLGARAIAAQGVSLAEIHQAAAAELGPEVDAVPLHIPFAAEAKELLQHTLSEALRLGHNYIGAEHLLLGLLAEPTSTGGRVLASHGVDPAAAEAWIRSHLERRAVPDQPPS